MRLQSTRYVYEHWLHKSYKVYKDYIEFDREQAENAKIPERRTNSFPKQQVKNVDLHTPALKKIMTIYD